VLRAGRLVSAGRGACHAGQVGDQYPPIEPYEHGMLDAGAGQQLYWETVGNPQGVPALFVHGGPGSGCNPGQRRFFDPAAYRGVLFDQRGCGRSRPLVSDVDVDLSVNTTLHLIGDMERLRGRLGIDRWLLLGMSWGSTLALAYAQRFPEHVSGLVLGPVTAGTRREIDWICREMGRVFPREWARLIALVPEVESHGSIPGAYAQLLSDPDPLVRADAAEAWRIWEDAHISLVPGYRPSRNGHEPERELVFARLVTHYWSNDCFLSEDEIFLNLDRLVDIPAVLVHGRYDVSSPLDTAWRLHHAWPRSRLVVVEDAGHSGPRFGSALVDALESFKSLPR
jgi:proline iminopeptidase